MGNNDYKKNSPHSHHRRDVEETKFAYSSWGPSAQTQIKMSGTFHLGTGFPNSLMGKYIFFVSLCRLKPPVKPSLNKNQ